jgi:serine O-acetyltransferase
MESIITLLLEDSRTDRLIDQPGDSCRPDPETVAVFLRRLRSLLFPGYFGQDGGCGSRESYLSMLVAEIFWRLDRMVAPMVPDSSRLCRDFLLQIPAVREAMEQDLQAYLMADPAAEGPEEIIVSYPGFYAIWVQRVAHRLVQLGVPLLPRMMTELAHSQTGIDIHPGAVLGESFFIDHGTGVVIGQTARIGNFVKIYQGVTLGAISTRGGQYLRGKKRHPTIEDAVTIYAGASILGGDTVIGKGAVIGANAFVTAWVEPGAVVIGHRTDP